MQRDVDTSEQISAELPRGLSYPSLPAPPYTIGLADGDFEPAYRSNWYQTPIVDGIFATARRLRHNVNTLYGYYSDAIDESLPAYLRTCHGLLHFYTSLLNGPYEAIRDFGLPMITIGGRSPDGAMASIDIDNVQATREVTRHLIELGHRRIAYFPADLNDPSTSWLRGDGYRLAHADAGLVADPRLTVSGHSEVVSGTERAMALSGMPARERPTAIVCYNDAVALGVLRAAPSLRLTIPADLSVTGFDDLVEVSMVRPALTTIRQPMRLIGERALELLIDIIEGRKPLSHQEVVHSELVVRQSTAPPPRA